MICSIIQGKELGVVEWVFLQGYDAEHDMVAGLDKRGILVAEMLVPRFERNDEYFCSTERNSSIYSMYCMGCGTREGQYHLSSCKSPNVIEIANNIRNNIRINLILFYPRKIFNSVPLTTDSPVVIESTKSEPGFFSEKIEEYYSKAREFDTVVSITEKEEDKNESKEEIICPGCEKIQKDCSNLYGACVRNRPWGWIEGDPREKNNNRYIHAGKSELNWAKDITKRTVYLIVMVDDNSDPP